MPVEPDIQDSATHVRTMYFGSVETNLHSSDGTRAAKCDGRTNTRVLRRTDYTMSHGGIYQAA